MRKILFAAALLPLAGGQAWAHQAAALDDGLFATFANAKTEVSFTVCGSTGDTEGCYGGGTMDPPFDYACGVLQGKPKTVGDTMTRAVYVLDKRTGSTDDMMLYVYQRKDVIANSSDSVSVSLKTTIDLGITGGAGAHCMMAGNDDYVYAATDASSGIATVSKHKNALDRRIAGRVAGTAPASLSADDRGYVVLNFNDDSFYVVDPHGNEQEDGGGNYGFINQRNGWIQN